LASHLLRRFRIRKISIEIRKFVLKDAAYAAVTVTRPATTDEDLNSPAPFDSHQKLRRSLGSRPNFGLVIRSLLSQTSGIMKTLSGTSKVMILVVIGMVAILSFRVFAQPNPEPTEPPASKATFVLKIKTVTPVKDEARFEGVLRHLRTQLYDIVLHEENCKENHLLPKSNRM